MSQDEPPSSEITPAAVYFHRRNFLRGGVTLASAAGTGLLYRRLNGMSTR
jgi:hypothetical protein